MEWKSQFSNGTTKSSSRSRSGTLEQQTSTDDTVPVVLVRKAQPSPREHSRLGQKQMEEQANKDSIIQNGDEAAVETRQLSDDAHDENAVQSLCYRKRWPDDYKSMDIPRCMLENDTTDRGIVTLLSHPAEDPPVTITTLKELDLQSIQNNLSLRIDINYDQDLFFQPITGPKGDAKQSEGELYWSALAAEFRIYLHNSRGKCLQCRRSRSRTVQAFRPRLATMFSRLREIVQMLVPEADHDEVANHLDTNLLMQQVHFGALDTVRLSTWLAALLTTHCAPMRDRSAAEVTEQICAGSENGDMNVFVQGLDKLFKLLEAMKLDVANHQIRAFRYILIDDTVDFQQDCFARAIDAQQIDVSKSQEWYQQESASHRQDCSFDLEDQYSMDFACFIHALVHLCDPNKGKVPLTFQHDHHRFVRLGEDLQDHIHINLCLAVFDNRVLEIAGPQINSSSMHAELKRRIICLTEDDDGNGGAISDHLEAIGVEITRAAHSMVKKLHPKTTSQNSLDYNHTIKLLNEVFQEEDIEQAVTKNFMFSLEERTMEFARQFSAMSTLEVSNAQKAWAQARSGKGVNSLAEWDDMARKLAHVGVLHWRIWEHLCYSSASEFDDGVESQAGVIELEADESPNCIFSTPSDSREHSVETGYDGAVDQRVGTMHTFDAQVQRQDSGFAEFSEDIDGKPGHGFDIELDVVEEDPKKRWSTSNKEDDGLEGRQYVVFDKTSN